MWVLNLILTVLLQYQKHLFVQIGPVSYSDPVLEVLNKKNTEALEKLFQSKFKKKPTTQTKI
jgi:hypothetical protein